MAFTVTKVWDQSVGSKKAATYLITADAATQTVASTSLGMKYIDYFSIGIKSCTTGAFKVYNNLDASGAASNGALGVSGIASGDLFYVTVYGR